MFKWFQYYLVLFIILGNIPKSNADTFGELKNSFDKFSEAASGYLQGLTSFESAPILKKRDEVVQIIKNRRQKNKKLMDKNPYAFEAEKEELNRKNNCNSDRLLNDMNTALEVNCRFADVLTLCRHNRYRSSAIVQNVNTKIQTITSSNIIERLKLFREDLKTALSQTYTLNVTCEQNFKNSITSETCLSTYESVFNQSMVSYLEYNCSEEVVELAVGTYIRGMRDSDIGIHNTINEIKAHYGESRKSEAGVAAILVNVDDTIKEWESKNSRSPSMIENTSQSKVESQ